MTAAVPAPRFFALIPAAGVGLRAGADCPKQYLPLAGKPMLRHVLDTFAGCPAISHTFVVVSAGDTLIDAVVGDAMGCQILRCGGDSRQASVLQGLHAAREFIRDTDWVLVHDAARPGLTIDLIERLISALRDDPVGGLLALPVADTLKRAVSSAADQSQPSSVTRVEETVPRAAIWAAQTPQMFRYGLLRQALEFALEHGHAITDDASAVEALGLQPRLVEGNPRNVKVTLPHDIALAELYLKGSV